MVFATRDLTAREQAEADEYLELTSWVRTHRSDLLPLSPGLPLRGLRALVAWARRQRASGCPAPPGDTAEDTRA